EVELRGPAQVRWLDALEREHDNLRAALAWCLPAAESLPRDETSPAGETGLRLASALAGYWWSRGHRGEGLAWLEQALAQGPAAPAALRAKALAEFGNL